MTCLNLRRCSLLRLWITPRQPKGVNKLHLFSQPSAPPFLTRISQRRIFLSMVIKLRGGQQPAVHTWAMLLVFEPLVNGLFGRALIYSAWWMVKSLNVGTT